MQIIYYLIPVALIFVLVGVYAFFWATKTDQFEDMEKHGLSILLDEDHNTDKPSNKDAD